MGVDAGRERVARLAARPAAGAGRARPRGRDGGDGVSRGRAARPVGAADLERPRARDGRGGRAAWPPSWASRTPSSGVLDGERLDLPDASVDGVLNRFGYILKGDPPPVLGEIRRVLRPGGRLAFAVWAARERNPWMTVPADVMVERGHLRDQTDEELRLSARRNPDSIASAPRRGRLRRAGDRGDAGRVSLRRRRRALVLRQRAPRAGCARARRASTKASGRRFAPRSNPAQPAPRPGSSSPASA